MRTLRTETAVLPAGIRYDIIQDKFGVRRCQWIGPDDLKRSARVDGKGQLARLTDAGPLYDAHVAALGCNPEEPIPCGHCGCELPACLTVCNECGNDPDGDAPCPACGDLNDEPLGYVDDWRDGYVTCPRCLGSKAVEGINAGEREAALAKARAWQASQRENPVPAGIGGGR